MFKKLKKASAAKRLLEEQLYKQVLLELDQGKIRDGLWGKALANSSGIEEKAKALYIHYRVQSIKDELEIFEEIPKKVVEKKMWTTKIIENDVEKFPMPLTTCRRCEQQFRMLKDTSHVNPICPSCLKK